jgi:hypothetical protein
VWHLPASGEQRIILRVLEFLDWHLAIGARLLDTRVLPDHTNKG